VTADEPRFLCDEMLAGIARWLRAAGYNTLSAEPGEDDARLLARAAAADALLLTRDRHILQHRAAAGRALLLEGGSLPEQARELRERLGIDWLHRPFSRCTVCNAPLADAPAEARNEVPPGARRRLDALWRCTGCGRLYWVGSHVARMRARLSAWQAGRF